MNRDWINDERPAAAGCLLRRILIPMVALAAVAAGCGGGDDDKGVSTGADVNATETSADDDGSSADDGTDDDGNTDDGDDDAGTSSTEPESSTTTETSTTETSDSDDGDDSTTTSAADDSSDTDDELPGEPIDLFVDIGDVLAVVGVSDDDTLNVRAKPGTDQDVLTTVGPTADDLVGTGRARSLPSSIWYEVSVDGSIGWVSSSFVAFVGGTDDATAEFLADGGSAGAETMTDLGQMVAERFASEDPPSRIVQTVAPTVGDLGEVTYDVVGIGDDAVLGFRLHIFATVDEGTDAFTLRTIERTVLCTRGLSGEACT